MIKRLVKVSLPSEYQQVEYISSDGNSYLNVDLRVDEGDVLTYDVDVKYEASDERRLMGGNPTMSSYFGVSPDATLQYFNINVAGQKINYKMTIDTVNLVVTHIYNNEQAFTQDSSISQLVCADNCLFDLGGWGLYNGRNQSIYCAKFTKNNILVRHLIPCYRKSDNVAGMYDVISNTFFTNASTGSFIVGNKTETVVTNRDRWNIDTITESTTIEYCEKEHIDYDDSELAKEITITRPCKLYIGFECKNSEQIPSDILPMPFSFNYEIKIGNTIYDSGNPNMNENSGDFEYVLLDITKDMLPYTTTISIRAHMYPNHPLAELEQVIHLYSDIYYTVGEIEVMKEIKAIKRVTKTDNLVDFSNFDSFGLPTTIDENGFITHSITRSWQNIAIAPSTRLIEGNTYYLHIEIIEIDNVTFYTQTYGGGGQLHNTWLFREPIKTTKEFISYAPTESSNRFTMLNFGLNDSSIPSGNIKFRCWVTESADDVNYIELKDITKINKIVNGEVKTINI